MWVFQQCVELEDQMSLEYWSTQTTRSLHGSLLLKCLMHQNISMYNCELLIKLWRSMQEQKRTMLHVPVLTTTSTTWETQRLDHVAFKNYWFSISLCSCSGGNHTNLSVASDTRLNYQVPFLAWVLLVKAPTWNNMKSCKSNQKQFFM